MIPESDRIALLAALDSLDPFPALRALLTAPPAPESPTPATLALRYVYHLGCFELPHAPGFTSVARPEHIAAAGQRVRVVYTYTRRDAARARFCAWAGRLREAGAVDVEMVGEEEAEASHGHYD